MARVAGYLAIPRRNFKVGANWAWKWSHFCVVDVHSEIADTRATLECPGVAIVALIVLLSARAVPDFMLALHSLSIEADSFLLSTDVLDLVAQETSILLVSCARTPQFVVGIGLPRGLCTRAWSRVEPFEIQMKHNACQL